MVPRPYSLTLLEDPALQILSYEREPANTVKRHPLDRTRDPTSEPEADHWLRWLKVQFGLETG